MKPIRAWGLAVTAVLGVGTVAAADEPVRRGNPPPTTVYAKWFGPAKPKVGPAARTNNAAPRPPAMPATLPSEVVAASLRAEQDAWERRMSVCLKLREVAIDANDEALIRQVDELERQATALYTARTKALGLPKSTPATIETSDEVKVAARKLAAPSPRTIDPAVRTAEARAPKDVIREVPQ